MFKVKFFASLKEQVNCSDYLLEPTQTLVNVAQLRDYLLAGDSRWAPLDADNIIVAVNQQVASSTTAISENDEIAFYPPVSGG